MLTFNVVPGYQRFLFRDFLWFIFRFFFSIRPTDPISGLCIKVGRGHGDAAVGTCDLGTRDEGLEDIKYGMRGRVGRGNGMWIIIAKVGGKCDTSHFPREYVLVKATHPAHLKVPPRLFTKRKLGKDPLHWRKWNRCPRLLAGGIFEPKVG